MKNWLQGGVVAAINSVADSFLMYISFAPFAPEALANPQILKGLSLYIAFNAAKTLAHYFRKPPSPPLESSSMESTK
jgi:hypothetical protein